jgi:hypothetical protein
MELCGWVNKFVRGCCRLRGGLRVVVAAKHMIFRSGISGNGGCTKGHNGPVLWCFGARAAQA